MNGLIMMLIALVVLIGAYLLYGRWLAKTWGIDPNAKTCYKVNGEVDYMRIEQTQREIAKVLSTKDTYATNAFTEYLNSYKFRFGDTSMYEYLKGQYPDLDIFDED